MTKVVVQDCFRQKLQNRIIDDKNVDSGIDVKSRGAEALMTKAKHK